MSHGFLSDLGAPGQIHMEGQYAWELMVAEKSSTVLRAVIPHGEPPAVLLWWINGAEHHSTTVVGCKPMPCIASQFHMNQPCRYTARRIFG